MTAEIHHVPTYDDGTAGEGAHCHETDGCVLDVEVVMDGQKDAETGDCEGDAEG